MSAALRTPSRSGGPRRIALPAVVRRWLVFGAVGTLGFVIQLTALVLLAGGLGIHYLIATAIAVELAILHNFLWHQLWTWSDRGAGGKCSVLTRLLRFNGGTVLTSVGGNLLIMGVMVDGLGLHYALANPLAVLMLGLVNFLFYDRLVFRSSRGGNAARVVAGSMLCANTRMAEAAATISAAGNECARPSSAAPPNSNAA
jgi:putative flippase GtrA